MFYDTLCLHFTENFGSKTCAEDRNYIVRNLIHLHKTVQLSNTSYLSSLYYKIN